MINQPLVADAEVTLVELMLPDEIPALPAVVSAVTKSPMLMSPFSKEALAVFQCTWLLPVGHMGF